MISAVVVADAGADDVRAAGASPAGGAAPRFDCAAERAFNWVIARYDRALNVVLDHQPLTLLVALATLCVTVWLYVVMPKGFFPVQDTGVIQGISVAAQTFSFDAMAQHQQELAEAILKDPDVVSLSSFIGVEGTNTTLNTGRFLINLKPKDAAHAGRHRDRPPAPAGDRRRRRRLALPAAGAGPDGRFRGQPHAVPVRAGEPQR